MSAGGPSKYCPRCDTALPLRAPQCDVCGFQFTLYPDSAPQDTSYGPPQYVGQTASGRWPLSQPGYPQWQPDYGSPYPPGAALPRRGSISKLIVGVLLLMIVIGGTAAAWFFYLSPSHPNSPFFDRHGVPASVPLPDNLTFDTTTSYSGVDLAKNETVTLDEWGWKVTGSSPAEIAQFYRDQMPGKGWISIRSQTEENGRQAIIGCQSTEVLVIAASSNAVQLTDNQGKPGPKVTAPAGGSALVIGLATTNSPKVEKQLCSGTS